MTAHDYEPSSNDIKWAHEAVRDVKEGGTITMPLMMRWTISHEKRTAILINARILETREGREAYLKMRRVFSAVGYTVAPA